MNWLIRLFRRPKPEMPEPGQVWLMDCDDPFSGGALRAYVKAVRDGWVQYRFDDEGIAWSLKTSTFVRIYRRVA